MSNDTNATGMLATNGSPFASTMPPLNTLVRPGLPSLKMITPTAPACVALSTFTPKLHVPRWTRAILPAKPLKSLGLHPLAELGVGVGGMTVPPAGLTWAPVASPWLFPGFQSLISVKLRAVGETSLKLGVPMYDEYVNVYGWMVTSYPALRMASAT